MTDGLDLDPSLRVWIREHLGGEITSVEVVQSLWSGYGRIARIHLRGATQPSAIIKQVEPPEDVDHPRGWSGEAGHERKLRSYEVERCFYTDWCSEGEGSHRTARCFSAENTGHGWRFLLEDLDAAGFDGRRRGLNRRELDFCLEWLASFHARFLGCAPSGLWPIGTYWHLATRKDELAVMEDRELMDAAPILDSMLNECRFQTLVHGDAKVANFCFGRQSVAAVDFQYIGGGCGIKDVAYFLGSCLDENECAAEAEEHLDTYFDLLRRYILAHRESGEARGERLHRFDPDEVVEEWHSLYAAAWADFHRFLVGWAPGHWKIHDYTRRMTREALDRL